MPMRTLTFLSVLAISSGIQAQKAIGAFGSAGEDLIWRTGQVNAGMLFEFRTRLIPPAVVRTSMWWAPKRGNYHEEYRTTPQPDVYRWLAATRTERHHSAGIALDLRFPFESNACSDGYFKGTYLLAGIGVVQRWLRTDRWEQDRNGNITSSVERVSYVEPMLRAGAGGELNFKWGGPFIEGTVTVSTAGPDQPTFRFPGSALITLGYRYSFAKPVPVSGAE